MFFLGLDHNAMLSLLKDPNLLIFSGHGRWSDYSSQWAVAWAIVFGVWGTDMTLGPAKEPKLLSSCLRKKKNWGTDAGPTIPNNGLPSRLLFSFWVWGTDAMLGPLMETNLPASC
jgi:hypothetical protein